MKQPEDQGQGVLIVIWALMIFAIAYCYLILT